MIQKASVLVWDEYNKRLDWQEKPAIRRDDGKVLSPVWRDEVGFVEINKDKTRENVSMVLEVINGKTSSGMTMYVKDIDTAVKLMKYVSPSRSSIDKAINNLK
jgi:hypothetical protein